MKHLIRYYKINGNYLTLKNQILKVVYYSLLLVCLLSCNKQNDWLDKKSNLNDVVPTTLKDYQSLMDNEIIYTNYSALGLLGSDNYYVNYTSLQSATATERNSYMWAPDIYEGEPNAEWEYGYERILYANAVIDGLEKTPKKENEELKWNEIKGAALFIRAFTFFDLMHIFAPPFNNSSSDKDLGIILKVTSDASENVGRSSVRECYNRIITDLEDAIKLLPVSTEYQTRPSKVSAYALLSKVYLHKGDYPKSLEYSSLALQYKRDLIDFNGLPSGQFDVAFPTIGNHPEIIFYAGQISLYTFIVPAYNGFVDSLLYKSYSDDDLRKALFYLNYNGGIQFKGSYAGDFIYCFSGLATNEIMFINIESLARVNRLQDAIDQLNTLLVKRYQNGKFQPLTLGTQDEVLKTIFDEKRKEFPFTGNIRWEELRRLNKDEKFAKTLVRKVNNKEYLLLPNDKRYVYPIPLNELRLNNILQNPR